MSEPSDLVFPVTEADFETAVLEKSKTVPVVVDFWAPWCGPCRQLAPILERLVTARAGQVLLAKVNIDEEQALAARYNIGSIPTLIAFRGGKPALDFVGLLPENLLNDFLDRIVPTEADRLAQEAQTLEAANVVQSEKLYRQALKKDANHDVAIVGLARALLQQSKDGEAAELLDRVGLGGDTVEVERLRAIIALQQQAHSIGDEATLQHRVEVDPKNAGALHELGVALAAAGKYPEALETLYRAAELDAKLARGKVREVMVQIFHAIGVRSALADDYRDRLSGLLY